MKIPKIDEKKEQLNEFRQWQNYCVTTFVAVVAFIATKYESIGTTLFWLCGGVVSVSAVAIVILAVKINKTIKEIGRL